MKLRNMAMTAGVLAAVALSAPAQAQTAKHQPLQKSIGQVTPTGPVPSLMVMNSQGATLADGVLTLTGVSPNTIVFADRPVRSAGHVTTAQFIQQWDVGNDNFAIDPPNATISVLGANPGEVDDAVVVLTEPKLDGTTLTFKVKVLEGQLGQSGAAALFIDDRGMGGGNGGNGGRDMWGTSNGILGGNFGDGGGIVIGGGGGNYYHAPDLHGAWYSSPSQAQLNRDNDYNNGFDVDPTSLCGEYPKPPCE
jgi:hypothetical protein